MIATAEALLAIGMFAAVLVLIGIGAALALMLWVWHLINQLDPTAVA